MDLLLLSLVSFVVTFTLTPLHIRIFKGMGVVGRDRHKLTRPEIPEMGGIAIYLGILCSFLYIIVSDDVKVAPYVLASITIVFIIGVIDDVFALRQRMKLALLTVSALPLLLYNSGTLDLAMIEISFGVLYAICVIIGMAASSNLTNILEGFNGESIGLGVISTGFLILDAHILENETMMWILVPVFFSLLAFLFFNKYPAKVFPGDTGTLMIGGAIGISVIIGGNVVLGIIVLIPQIMEFIIKSRVRFQGVKYGPTKVDENGYLSPPPYLSIANMFTSKFRLKEYSLVLVIWALGALFGIISLLITLFVL